MLDFVFDGFKQREITVADVGAGTGISSRLLAARGATVIAIDPNAEMLRAADVCEGVHYQHGAAEATNLPDESVDIVTAFQALHWFARDEAMREFHRILKRPGRVAFAWNNRDRTNPFDTAYANLVQTFGEEARIIDSGKNVAPVEKPLEQYGFSAVTKGVFYHEQRLNRDGIIGRARSTSYLPQEGPEFERLREALVSLHRQFADAKGFVRFAYRTVAYRGDLR
ncbi:MAG: class I SAM-dependent methyltransferase [Candidatus Eremiobacteraeota bacterium]|nr:class I SAM-dependent methyltransferase [Candidatus Eremiobacteraeota bacterium]